MCPQVLVPQSVDRTLGQARDAGHLWDGAPFGDEQHGLAATKESNIVSVAQGARQALAVAPRETKLRRVGWPSHEISISQRAILPEIIGYSLWSIEGRPPTSASRISFLVISPST